MKTESHIIEFSNEIDINLAVALGNMVVAFGRLEDMLKVVIKRVEKKDSLKEVIDRFSGLDGTIGKLKSYCETHKILPKPFYAKLDELNKSRQDFVHATIALTEDGKYIRFRKLNGYADLTKDIADIEKISKEVNGIIIDLDRTTGQQAGASDDKNIIVTVSAA